MSLIRFSRAQTIQTIQTIHTTDDVPDVPDVPNNHTCHDFDRTNDNKAIHTVGEHDRSTQHNATKTDFEVISATIPSIQQIPTANNTLPSDPVSKLCNTRSTIKDQARVSPRRTRSKVAAVDAEEEVPRAAVFRRTRSAHTAKKRKGHS
ncbi:uncharacterized protein MELLADRAFT_101386 [Melampsora larici-populina 98AG31]|uniref:Uncharacterized protein n=1 Tax=Melampsora larici-populina (strain 98AG31 / pathotype 3-4-7) TaxID=747676 RepID=F4R4K4_MELLP|nr:uncharacterized protein MELLADRAFT_101386 [Melampsora larici-populina 98AG31]EGG12985.1 hypothetical protein MELLADRAFT_101386 [Melampsora larici-populina 98AG31]